jgi:hypothetical protein
MSACSAIFAQIHLGIDDVAFELGALELQPGQVDLGDISCAKALAIHLQHFVVIGEIGLGELLDSLGLQGADEGVAEAEQQLALEILLICAGHLGGKARALDPQRALAAALPELREALGPLRGLKGFELLGVEEQKLIVDRREDGIGAETGGDFVGAGLLDRERSGLQVRVVLLEAVANLIPGQRALGGQSALENEAEDEEPVPPRFPAWHVLSPFRDI